MTETLLVVARTIHFAAVLIVLGELVFAVLIAPPMRARDRDLGSGDRAKADRRLVRVASLSLALSVVAGVAWFLIAVSTMSGLPFIDAMNAHTLDLALFQTGFGRLGIVRLGVALVLGTALVSVSQLRAPERKRRAAQIALPVALVYAGTLAWAGHAGAGLDPEREVHLGCDTVHLIAAGAWLGALPALIAALGDAWPRNASAIARRFSRVGMVSVAALVLSGIANAWFLVGDLHGLFHTAYGCVLCAKIGLFALMVALALVNRLKWTPRLLNDDLDARGSLRRNAVVETVLGLAVILIVGLLGTMLPAAHQQHHHHAAGLAPSMREPWTEPFDGASPAKGSANGYGAPPASMVESRMSVGLSGVEQAGCARLGFRSQRLVVNLDPIGNSHGRIARAR